MILFAMSWSGRRCDGVRGGLGVVRRRAARKKGALLLGRMATHQSVCLRRLAGGSRRGIVGFGRFISNPKVTTETLIEGWSAGLSAACAGRHVLAIQDTSESDF